MPVLTEPSLGPIVSGKYTADAVIDTDLHVDAFEIENNAVVTILINGELAMDAGGVVPMVAQYLDLDRLGLADGATHRLELFYAQRQPISSVFRLRTDLVLSPTAGPRDVTAICD